jgi:biopolymer transport protein ExbD
MADMGGGKKGAPRVDMTPMVDLGFLLITFFMLTTTMVTPKTMEIIKPAKPEKEDDRPPVKQSTTLSILLGENDKVYFYTGSDDPKDAAQLKVDSADFSQKGIRSTIQTRQEQVAAQWGNKDELVVLIKAMPTSKYKNMVDILDEMKIDQVKQYALVDLDKIDTVIMQSVHALK